MLIRLSLRGAVAAPPATAHGVNTDTACAAVVETYRQKPRCIPKVLAVSSSRDDHRNDVCPCDCPSVRPPSPLTVRARDLRSSSPYFPLTSSMVSASDHLRVRRRHAP
ncbi:hypothetical protein NP493_728g01081 [Ridgeia piscesae]|uniref:Uncharacterized protein n=1 Tax=Ridgeia piscesae TaxID=27915 RepID=A0AAD9NM99_RIDPI|nr:hypothetical protein NP493_728g01081 [Ridgeia piscesae]